MATAVRAAEMTVPVKNLFLEATVAVPAAKTNQKHRKNQNHQRKNQAARVETAVRAVEMIVQVKNLFQEATVVAVKVLNALKIIKKPNCPAKDPKYSVFFAHLTHIGSTIVVME